MNRNIFTLIFLCLAFCAGAAHAALINGQNYVPLADWARANGLKSYWSSRTEMVLADRTARLVFNTDSAESEINGVDVRLSFPVAKGALISQLD
ncbi:MAG TPA: hypothetical protein VMV89_13510, partial [Candidatus Paceibacterota bacterium]|nr:hypothetical protein [Candidatus Paceibacterota bacterium]